MKRNPRLGTLENLSLVGLVAGSIASLVSKQILYTTMPMSLLVVLDLLSRRQFENSSRRRDLSLAETDQKLSSQVDLLNQHITTLPSTETVHRLRQGLLMKDREVARRLYAEIMSLQQELNQRLHPLEQQGIASVRQEITQLETQYQQVAEDLAGMNLDLRQLKEVADPAQTETAIAQLQSDVTSFQTHLESLTNQGKPNFSSLQEQISRLDRQFSKLPPPVDLSSLKQEVGELVRMMSDLVPRRDLLTLVKEVRELYQQQELLKQSVVSIETAAVSFNSVFGNLLKLPPTDAGADADASSATQSVLSGRLEQEIAQQMFHSSATLPSATAIQEEAANYLEHLRSQLAEIQSFTKTLATQNQRLQEQMNHLPKSLDMVALQSQLRELSQRIPVAETRLDDFRGRIQEVVQQELQYISQQLQTVPATPNYELMFDLAQEGDGLLTGSRALLEEALNDTQNRLILILPWANQCSLDQTLLQQLEAFLKHGRRLDIGWCNWVDRHDERLLKKIQQGWMPNAGMPNAGMPNAGMPNAGMPESLTPHPLPQDAIQATLRQLLNFKRTYPKNFQFKILGTQESFLVSDQSFAVLGIADALKTKTALSEVQLKLRTRDPEAIQRLIDRFEHPILEPEDLVSYWNRGATRHDLGDKLGAIADYTHVLQFAPDTPELAPKNAVLYSYRGNAYYDLGEITSAIDDLTEAIRLNPQQAIAYCNRAFIRSEQGDLTGAIGDYTQAIQIQPDWAIAFFYRGMAWQKLERHQDAIADYGEATYLAPDSAVVHYYRGLSWQKLRNTQGAIDDLEKAATLFTQSGSLRNAQKALKSLAKLRQVGKKAASYSATPSPEANPKEAAREPIAPDFEAIASLFKPIPTNHQVNDCNSVENSAPSAISSDPLTFQDLFDAEERDTLSPMTS